MTGGLLLATLGWLAVLLAAPVAVSRGADSPAASIAIATYSLGRRICHQRAERSFHIERVQMPVCARCTGFYVGAPLGLAWALLAVHWRRDALGRIGPRRLILLAAAPTLASLAVEASARVSTPGALRAAFAMPLAVIVARMAGDTLCAS